MDKPNPFLAALLAAERPKQDLNPWADALLARPANTPGRLVQVSGIYRVDHDKNHLQPHQVICVKDERFPPCRGCGMGITYSLVTPALHLSEHAELSTRHSA